MRTLWENIASLYRERTAAVVTDGVDFSAAAVAAVFGFFCLGSTSGIPKRAARCFLFSSSSSMGAAAIGSGCVDAGAEVDSEAVSGTGAGVEDETSGATAWAFDFGFCG